MTETIITAHAVGAAEWRLSSPAAVLGCAEGETLYMENGHVVH
ncbi:MAG: hypothetical protein WCD21_22650 [Streptomyces sp.]